MALFSERYGYTKPSWRTGGTGSRHKGIITHHINGYNYIAMVCSDVLRRNNHFPKYVKNY